MTAGAWSARTVGMAMVMSVLTAGAALGQPSKSEGLRLEGTWRVRITPTVCATGLPVPNVTPVNSLQTFAPGGTIAESTGGSAPGQRGPGHGTWHHEGGQTFSQSFVALINFTTAPGPGPGFQAGWQTVTQTVTLVDRDNFESVGTTAFYNLNDESPYREGCSTAIGTRFQ